MDSEALSQFVAVTGATPDAAQFFLDSAKGDVAAAVDQYFAAGGQAQQEDTVPADVQQEAAPTAITPATSNAASSAPAKKPAAGWSRSYTLASLLLPTFHNHHISSKQTRICWLTVHHLLQAKQRNKLDMCGV